MTKSKKVLIALQKFCDFIAKIESVLITVGAFAIVAVTLTSVLCRYVLYIAVPWADELARYLFLWIAFIGMGYVTYKWNHIDVQLIDTILIKRAKDPDKAIKYVIKLSQILSLCVLLLSIYFYYFHYLKQLYPSISPSLQIPMAVPYSSVLCGLILMVFHCLCVIILPKQAVETQSATDKKA